MKVITASGIRASRNELLLANDPIFMTQASALLNTVSRRDHQQD